MKTLFVTKSVLIEPLGIMYLSAAAKAAGHDTRLATTSEDLERKLRAYCPDVVGYSVMTGDQNYFLELNKKLKKNFDFVSLFGGPHPTFFPDMIKEGGVDFICQGEGEEAFVDLLNSLEEGRGCSNIPNIGINLGGECKINAVRQLSDINSLPFPDREILDEMPNVRHGPIKHFIASRGCPFSCSYCFNEVYSEIYKGKGKRVRFRNPDSLVEEIKDVVSQSPTRFVYFQDDTITLNKAWLGKFLESYSSGVKMPFHCHVRANTIDEETVELLRDAGCYSVHIAAEAGDDRLRNEILSRNMSREQIKNSSELLRKKGIKFMLQNIIGLPTGSIEDDIKTLELNVECKPDYAWVSIYQPYPGTRLGEFCKEEGYYGGDFNDLESNFYDSSKLNFSDEYKNQLANLQKLFAIFVEHPELHRSGVSRTMINLRSSEMGESYKLVYQEFRKKADERLYGFRL